MVVTNNGPSTANGVALTDTVPAERDDHLGHRHRRRHVRRGARRSSAAIDARIGAPVTVTATGTIAAPTTASGTSLANTATVAASARPRPDAVEQLGHRHPARSRPSPTSASLLTAVTPTITAGLGGDLHRAHRQQRPVGGAATSWRPDRSRRAWSRSSVRAAGVCVLTDQIVTCNVGTFARLLRAIARASRCRRRSSPSHPAGPDHGTAFVGSSTPDTNPANNQDPETIQVIDERRPGDDQDGPANLVAGGEATYTLTVRQQRPVRRRRPSRSPTRSTRR